MKSAIKETTAMETALPKAGKQAQVNKILTGYEDTISPQGEAEQPVQKKDNHTGLSDDLKSGVESLSGYSLDDVKVHYNSAKPAELQAHAYAQGTDIHVGPGQEKHLPHEAWHVVQQKQGRVKPTMQMKGAVNVNDDVGLEKEADIMGNKAMSSNRTNTQLKKVISPKATAQLVIQMISYSEAIIGKNYIIYGVVRQLVEKGYGWLKFSGLEGSVRASEVDEVPVNNGSTSSTTVTNNLTPPGNHTLTASSAPSHVPTTPSSSTSGNNASSTAYGDMDLEYDGWTPQHTFASIDTPFGPINARHNRKAPYITTNTDQYPNTAVKVDYKEIIIALKKQGISDKEIAEILLEAKNDELTQPNAIRAAAMLIAIVYLAEEWRKQGAVKIFRAILRLIQSGKMTLSDIPRVFEFVASAQNGREQVGRIHEVLTGSLSFDSLDADDQAILGSMSPLREGDLDSEDDMRNTKEKDFKKGRAWGKYGKQSLNHQLDPSNFFKVNGSIYNIAHTAIRHNGFCGWDTLEYFGVNNTDLHNAAIHTGIAYGNYLDADQLAQVVNYLNMHGYSISISLDQFTYSGLFIKNIKIGNGTNVYKFGLAVDPHGLGHFIPGIN